jgi:hypothetical protein
MRTRLLVLPLLVTALVLGAARPAAAKGPSEAVIEAAGLDAPITVAMDDGDGQLMRLVNASVFWQTAGGTMTGFDLSIPAPTGDLGPEVTITWRWPTGETTEAEHRQRIYLWADGGAVMSVPGGQPTMIGDETTGLWYAVAPGLEAALADLGVTEKQQLGPERVHLVASTGAAEDAGMGPPLLALAALVALLAGGSAAAHLMHRSRRGPSDAST